MMENGFKINECDKCVYVKDTENDYIILHLYVDGMLSIVSNAKVIKVTENMLNSRFYEIYGFSQSNIRNKNLNYIR